MRTIGPLTLLEGVLLALPELLTYKRELVVLGDEKIISPLLISSHPWHDSKNDSMIQRIEQPLDWELQGTYLSVMEEVTQRLSKMDYFALIPK